MERRCHSFLIYFYNRSVCFACSNFGGGLNNENLWKKIPFKTLFILINSKELTLGKHEDAQTIYMVFLPFSLKASSMLFYKVMRRLSWRYASSVVNKTWHPEVFTLCYIHIRHLVLYRIHASSFSNY